MNKKATMHDIASEAGVSQPVVSAVLSAGPSTTRVSAGTRRKILKIARRLDYKKDILARAFQKQQSFLIGILLSGVNYQYAADFTFGAQKVISDYGYAPVFFTHGDTSQERKFLTHCLDRRVEALIVNCAVDPDGRTDAAEFERLHEEGVPIIEVFGRFIRGVPSVNLGYRDAGCRAVEVLVAKGHRDIGLFTHEHYRMKERSDTELFWNAWEQWQGYEEAIRNAGLTPMVFTHPLTSNLTHPGAIYRGACPCVEPIFKQERTPTALVCQCDEQADAVLHTVDRLGISVSLDFHVANFGGYSCVTATDSRLTTLYEPVTCLGAEAAARIFDLIEGKKPSSLTLGPEEHVERFGEIGRVRISGDRRA